MRQYKPRWFVLDAERNHLTYYNSEADTQLQGYIDLGELRACRPMPVPQGAAKFGDARSYFEVTHYIIFIIIIFFFFSDRYGRIEWFVENHNIVLLYKCYFLFF